MEFERGFGFILSILIVVFIMRVHLGTTCVLARYVRCMITEAIVIIVIGNELYLPLFV